MIKRILSILMIIIICAFCLTACDQLKQWIGDNVCLDGHTFTEWVETVAPTCTKKGVEQRYCSSCMYYETREKDELGHDTTLHDAKLPSCYEMGWIAYETCSRCDYNTYAEVPTINHDIVYHDAKNPSCTEVGWNAYEACSRCDYSTREEIPTVSHTYVGFECSVCKAVLEASVGLEFTSNGDGTCSVSGIGSCTDTDVVIPRTSPDGDIVTGVLGSAFCDCANITSVRIPDSVTQIGERAIYSCYKLTSIIVDENNQYYKSIDGNLYSKDGTLILYAAGKTDSEFVIPEGVTAIGNYAFESCHGNLESVIIPEGVISIGESALSSSQIKSIHIPASVTDIAYNAFRFCMRLANITVAEGNLYYQSIDGNLYTNNGQYLFRYAVGKTDTEFNVPENVSTIGSHAFETAIFLEKVILHANLENIGEYAFYESNLTSIVIPAGVTNVGDWAFASCKKLCEVTFSEGFNNTISNHMFYDCDSLKSIVIPNSVTSFIDSYAFYGCDSLESIIIGSGVTHINGLAFEECNSLTSITVDADNASYRSFDGNLYNKNGTILIKYATGKTDSKFVVPSGVTAIGERAFSYCTGLKEITITYGVTVIDHYAFYNCSNLTSVIMPGSIEYILDSVFAYCTSLESIVIPDGVKGIGARAFLGCTGLTSVIIPDSVTTIDNSAFSSCTSLANVYYKGSEEQWAQIINNNRYINNATITYNYQG